MVRPSDLREGVDMRNVLYLLARLLGDYRAVRRGRIGKRVTNKLIGRYIVPKLWRR